MALTEPVSITRNGRERIVLLSVEEYHRLKKRARTAHLVGDLSDGELEAITDAEMAEQHHHLDDELK